MAAACWDYRRCYFLYVTSSNLSTSTAEDGVCVRGCVRGWVGVWGWNDIRIQVLIERDQFLPSLPPPTRIGGPSDWVLMGQIMMNIYCYFKAQLKDFQHCCKGRWCWVLTKLLQVTVTSLSRSLVYILWKHKVQILTACDFGWICPLGVLWHEDRRRRNWKNRHRSVWENCLQNSWQLCVPGNRRGEEDEWLKVKGAPLCLTLLYSLKSTL